MHFRYLQPIPFHHLLNRPCEEVGGFSWVLPFAALLVAFLLCERVRLYVPGFDVDYGFFGVLLPVIAWHGKERAGRFWYFAAGLLLLCAAYGG